MEALEKRPSNCKIDSCSFISAAIEAKKELESIGDLQKVHLEVIGELEAIAEVLFFYDEVLSCNASLTSVYRYIDSFGIILKKLPNGFIFSDRKEFVNRLLSHDTFEDIYSIIQYLDIANMIEQYHVYKKDFIFTKMLRRIEDSIFKKLEKRGIYKKGKYYE